MQQYRYIQIVRTCNQNCLFCSNPSNGKTLSLQRIRSLVRLYKKEGAQGIILTGGEPTLHPQIEQAISYAKKNGLEIKMITNAQKIHEFGFLKKLVEAGLDYAIISTYSHNPKIQAHLTRNKNSLQNILKALEATKKMPLNVQLNVALNAYNIKDLDKTVFFFLKKFPHITHFTFNNLDPTQIGEDYLDTIPNLSDIKKKIPKALGLIVRSGKTTRVERVPLCCMPGYEHLSTETRSIVKGERKTIFFLDERKMYRNEGFSRYIKGSQCAGCSLSGICAGLEYSKKGYDIKELRPQKKDKKKIIDKIR
jgi:MoaA/NifB/PqqE/SkfB family radical SAM enzyme